MSYQNFISRKGLASERHGFEPLWLPDFLKPFQTALDDWAIRTGRAAILADCGLGKTPLALVWGENMLRKTNKPGLILTPLAVAPQFVREGKKFGIEVHRCRDGKLAKGVNVTNYEQLHKFDWQKVGWVVVDESGILKNFDGKYRRDITAFLQNVSYRLLCTATPAPNDHMELGTSSEALGVMSRNNMLGMFFVNGQDTTQQWVLKGHARTRFWQWCGTWARAVRRPSDMGPQFDDAEFVLPPLDVQQHILPSKERRGFFARTADTLEEQRKEKRKTIPERVAKTASVLPTKESGLVFCQLNDEADELEKAIPGARQVSGSQSDEEKEEAIEAFIAGQIRVLVSKPKIICFGLNLQHCRNVAYYPSWSHEAYYQSIRRCWRFGQKKPVVCHLVYTEAETPVAQGMLRKERQSIEMYENVVRHMNDAIKRNDIGDDGPQTMKLPEWL
jgi:hypothetical protein